MLVLLCRDNNGVKKWRGIYDSLVVGPSRFAGRGLFAGTRIPARAKIGEYEGKVIGLAEARRRAKGRRIVAIVELERHAIDAAGMRRGFRYINHSCEPNVGFAGNVVLVAMRDVDTGEELTTDYALFDDYDGHMECSCGTASCRQTIDGRDWRRADLQRRYGTYFSWYLLRRFDRSAGNPG